MKKFTIILIVLLVIFFGWYFYRQSLNNRTDFLNVGNPQFSSTELNYTISPNEKANNPIELTICEIPLKSVPEDRKVYFYFDKNYPIIGTSISSTLGVYDHLLAEYQQKNIAGEIQQVNSLQLADALNDKSGIIIMASGVLPDTIYSPNKNLLSPWIQAGGTLFWIGDGLGYYYGTSGAEIKSDKSPYAIGWSGQEKILGQNFLNGPYVPILSDSKGDAQSTLSSALGIKSQYTQTGVLISSLVNNNSIDLGYHYNFISDARTSLSEIKIGKGNVFIFGSPLLNREIDVAWDISQIIVSGVINADIQKINSRKLTIASGDKEQLERQINIGSNKNVRVIIFSTDFAKRYFLLKDFNRE